METIGKLPSLEEVHMGAVRSTSFLVAVLKHASNLKVLRLWKLRFSSNQEVAQLVEALRGCQSLEKINSQDDREVDQVRETVRAIYRVFQLGDKASGNDYPALSKPTGWSGEVGDGPTTAWDALPPKPWKPSNKTP